MEHSLHFRSPRRWLVLWTGSSDPIEKKHLKVAFHNLGACDVQTDRKMEKGEQFYSIEQTAAPSKQMLNISYSFVCKHSNLQEKIFPKGIGWPFQVEPFRKEEKKKCNTLRCQAFLTFVAEEKGSLWFVFVLGPALVVVGSDMFFSWGFFILKVLGWFPTSILAQWALLQNSLIPSVARQNVYNEAVTWAIRNRSLQKSSLERMSTNPQWSWKIN